MTKRNFASVCLSASLITMSLADVAIADCRPDCNQDGKLNINDFICFQTAWRARTAYGDYDASGTYTVNDFIRFQADFAATVAGGGCPAVATDAELAGRPLSAYPLFEFVNSFNTGSVVSLGVDPSLRAGVAGKSVDVFVTADKSASQWTSDPSLTDVRGAKQTVAVGSDLASGRFALTGSGSLATGTGTDIAKGYDLVLDVNRNAVLDQGDYIDGRDGGPGFWVVKDLTVSGGVGVGQVSTFVVAWDGIPFGYDEERIYYPADIASRGEVPLVVISHGAGHQYTWYDYVGDHLASHGYVVMSHQNNFRGDLVLYHIDAFLDSLGAIEGGILSGHIDSDRISLIGHSRGGESVVMAYSLLVNGQFTPLHYTTESIILIDAIAPTVDKPAGVTDPYSGNFELLFGSSDGDVCGCPGFELADSFIILERGAGSRTATYVQGADHNDFNCCGFDDFSGPPGTAIGREEAQQVAKASFLALEKWYAEGDRAAQEYLFRQFENLRAVGIKPTTIVDREYKEAPGPRKLVLDDFQTNPSTSVASTGAAVTYTVEHIYEGLMRESDSTFKWSAADPMNGMTRAFTSDTTKGVVFDWNGSPAYYQTAVPATSKDLSGYTYLSFRACQQTQHPLTTAKLEDLTFTVTIRDGSGTTSSIGIGAYSGGIEEVYQRQSGGTPGWQNEFETIRIRLTDFTHVASGLDLKNVSDIRLDFGPGFGAPEGRIGFDDLEVIK